MGRNQDRHDERSELAGLQAEVERLAAMVRTINGATVQEQWVNLQQMQQVAALEARLALVESRDESNQAAAATREGPKKNDGGDRLEAKVQY
jgi:hypothetical protein